MRIRYDLNKSTKIIKLRGIIYYLKHCSNIKVIDKSLYIRLHVCECVCECVIPVI